MAQLGHQGQEGTREDQIQLLGQLQGAKGRVLGDRGSGTGGTQVCGTDLPGAPADGEVGCSHTSLSTQARLPLPLEAGQPQKCPVVAIGGQGLDSSS